MHTQRRVFESSSDDSYDPHAKKPHHHAYTRSLSYDEKPGELPQVAIDSAVQDGNEPAQESHQHGVL